jgi:hypothetical protein
MNDITSKVACPREDEIAAFAADPIREDCADVAAHIAVCDRCRDVLAAVVADGAEVETTPEEDAFMADFAAKHCRRLTSVERLQAFIDARRVSFVSANERYFMAAAPAAGGQVGEAAPCSPDEEVRFVFAGGGEANYWRAELLIPPVAGPDTMLDVRVTGSGDVPAGDGTLRLAGCSLPLSDGGASLPFSLFLDGLRDTEVSFARAGREPVEGRLLFF